uniref:Vesicle-trafficking protein SEC22b n=1 Tax=Hirondellea gigas TaxID=1518452 RepID=A0A6A7G7X9_9CRUS
MALFTLIGRTTDGMPLVGTQDSNPELKGLKREAKLIIKALKTHSPTRCTIEAQSYFFHYLIEDSVCYITLVDRGYPKQLAFQYLETVQRAFSREHQNEIPRFSRPYGAVNFDPQLNRIRKDFLDPRAPQNLRKLNENLSEIHDIMQQNIQDVLERGDKMERVQARTTSLLEDSKKFKSLSKWINIQAFYKQWAPLLAILAVIIFFLWYRFW